MLQIIVTVLNNFLFQIENIRIGNKDLADSSGTVSSDAKLTVLMGDE